MALTVEQQGRRNVAGNRLTVNLKLTFASTYATGGEALDLTTYVPNVENVNIEGSDGYVFSYDRTNGKVLAWEAGADSAALDQVSGSFSATTYLSVQGGRA
jgi:hypothetical protein